MNVGITIVQKEKMPTKDEMAKFAKSIEDFVIKTNYNYIDAIVEYCKTTGTDAPRASECALS